VTPQNVLEFNFDLRDTPQIKIDRPRQDQCSGFCRRCGKARLLQYQKSLNDKCIHLSRADVQASRECIHIKGAIQRHCRSTQQTDINIRQF